ncbi:MAG: SoxR reducing system RseC family protein [Candidatus Aminicenantes bacterium]|nr:SoxR reducing system RseC family protein [Candidatus Aminicenantes bacterium]
MRPMKDKGTVLTAEKDFAQVQVNCLDACAECPAHSLCIKNTRSEGILSAKNPLQARPGDMVLIEIKDIDYSKALIHLFGILLAGCLLGLGAGYLISTWTSLASSLSGSLGVLFGILLAGSWLFHYFRHKKRENLYPVITAITQKGECHA